jgi:tRNA 2-thiouridine synthesizing protein B
VLLHTVNKSPGDSTALASALRSALPGCHLLLIEDGVYGAMAGTPTARQLRENTAIHSYALRDDVLARGLEGLLEPAIELIDYTDFVRLSITCHAVQSWY